MPCSLSQSSSPYILKDLWALESQWEFIIHRYHHLLHFQLRKKHSAGHFIHFLIKIVTQLPAAHKNSGLSHSPTPSPALTVASVPWHTAPLLPLLHLSQHMGTSRLLTSALPSIDSLMWHHFGTYLMKTGTWRSPKQRMDLRVRMKQKDHSSSCCLLVSHQHFSRSSKEAFLQKCAGSSKLQKLQQLWNNLTTPITTAAGNTKIILLLRKMQSKHQQWR